MQKGEKVIKVGGVKNVSNAKSCFAKARVKIKFIIKIQTSTFSKF